MPKITRACCALRSAVEAQIFVKNPRNWWSTDLHLTWNISDCSVALRFVFLTQQQRHSTVSTLSSVCTLCLPLPGRLSTVPNFTSSLLMLFFGQPLFRNFVTVKRCNLYSHTDFCSTFCLLYWTASKLPRLLDAASKFALFSVSGLKDQKLIKSKPTWKLKQANSTVF